MDIQSLYQTASHNPILVYAAGAASAVAVSNMPLLIRKFVASKWITALIRKDPVLAKAIVAELQKDVDAVADAAPVVAPPKP